ncbi:MAG: DNA polymerase III subunit gamma/tau [Patescibacteria group bacterium]
MSEVLYRKYRSASFDDVVGQPHITTTLKNALKNGNIAHAYLFTGPRGVGKTSVARILAYQINHLAYELGNSHLDIIEIDAASNRRIDEIRDLRDKVHIAPTSAKYKVYIIDEVHMLTKEAFNALLKTLEEPPAHVVFILATTEAHKVPETIISRTQRFSFKHIDVQVLAEHLAGIAKKENLIIDESALNIIAEHANGSFRDAISMLDQIRGLREGKIVSSDVEQFLGIAPKGLLIELYNSLSNKPKDVYQVLAKIRQQGILPAAVAHQLLNYLRTETVEGNLPVNLTNEYTEISKQLLAVGYSQAPETELEIVCVGAALKNVVVDETLPEVIQAPAIVSETVPPLIMGVEQPNNELETLGSILPEMLETWQKVLAAIKSNHNTLYSFLRMVRPEFEDNKLTLYAKFPFHQKRLSDSKNLTIIAEQLEKFSDQSYEIVSSLDIEPPASEPQKNSDSDTVATISNIFGGGEVLES